MVAAVSDARTLVELSVSCWRGYFSVLQGCRGDNILGSDLNCCVSGPILLRARLGTNIHKLSRLVCHVVEFDNFSSVTKALQKHFAK